MIRHFGIALIGLVVLACERGDPCTDTGTCPVDMLCEIPRDEKIGICIACEDEEIPYDGVDNDCLERTRDQDLDGDGDNWIDAPIRPGQDCDDEDNTTYAGAPERCGDERDNDCDGTVDEPQCMGQAAPSIRLSSPPSGAIISERILLALVASDDYGVARVELFGPRGVQLAQTDRPPYNFDFDTRTLEDGPLPIVARAVDLADLRTSIAFEFVVDNKSGPTFDILQGPVDGGRYGGWVTTRLTASDPSEVGRIDLIVDSIRVATSSTSTITAVFDTRNYADGPHQFTILGVDQRGSERRITRNIVVDNSPPTVVIGTWTDGQSVTVGVHTVEVQATDPAGVMTTSLGGQQAAGPTLTATVAIVAGSQTVTASAVDIVVVDDRLTGQVGSTSLRIVGVSAQ